MCDGSVLKRQLVVVQTVLDRVGSGVEQGFDFGFQGQGVPCMHGQVGLDKNIRERQGEQGEGS